MAEALPYLEESYRLRKQYRGEEFHSTQLAANRLGQALLKLGQIERAEKLLEPAYQSSVRHFSLDHPSTLRLASTLAQCHLLSGRVDAAAQLVELGLEHADARLPPFMPAAPNSCIARARSGSAAVMAKVRNSPGHPPRRCSAMSEKFRPLN